MLPFSFPFLASLGQFHVRPSPALSHWGANTLPSTTCFPFAGKTSSKCQWQRTVRQRGIGMFFVTFLCQGEVALPGELFCKSNLVLFLLAVGVPQEGQSFGAARSSGAPVSGLHWLYHCCWLTAAECHPSLVTLSKEPAQMQNQPRTPFPLQPVKQMRQQSHTRSLNSKLEETVCLAWKMIISRVAHFLPSPTSWSLLFMHCHTVLSPDPLASYLGERDKTSKFKSWA